MDSLVKFDAAVISFLEKHLHRFQRLTGKTNFWIGKQVCMLQIVLWAAFLTAVPLENFQPSVERSILGLTCVVVSPIAFITAYSRAKRFDQKEQAAFMRLREGVANEEKNRGEIRVLHVIMMVLVLFVISHAYHGVFTRSAIELIYASEIVNVYLRACDPLPPCDGKIKEWLQSFKPAPALEPARVPNTRS